MFATWHTSKITIFDASVALLAAVISNLRLCTDQGLPGFYWLYLFTSNCSKSEKGQGKESK